uniref:Methionine--tRNA ligase, cytoplasmic n=1 Tax=Syphacia muris TaxID=451379 RepID=A0A0N5AUT3_9BILA
MRDVTGINNLFLLLMLFSITKKYINGKKNVLITAALPYVNNVPHLGNIIGCVLSADVFARYCRLKGWRFLYVCGTDEYGTATETKAIQENMTPKEICDKYNALHKKIYDWFNIEFDHFGRTSTEHQKELVQDLFLKLHKNGFTTTATVNQLHCDNCNRFLADRFVHGECPYCHYDDARGDQCDGCTKLINAVELINPKCHLCNSAPVLFLHVFFPEVQKHLDSQLSSSDCHWSSSAISISKSWLKNGLEKRCITRDLKWGIPVPLSEFSDKVFYVWFDAPVGYLSITKELLGDDWKLWWKNPDNVELYNFVGKDNVAFHSVMFPASLLGARDNYTIVNQLCATEYLNYEESKFSKSRGTGVFGDMVSEIGIDADVWRFYLLYMRPENQDTAFSWDDFTKRFFLKVNTELLSNLGNFINRSLTFLASTFGSEIQEMELSNPEFELISTVSNELKEYDRLISCIKFRDALIKILRISRLGNQYMQSMQPWVLCKGDNVQRKRAGTIISVSSNIACLLGVLLHPYMPEVSKRILHQCGLAKLPLLPKNAVAFLKCGHKIGQPTPLFTTIEKTTVETLKKKFMGKGGVQMKKSEKGIFSNNCKVKEGVKKDCVDATANLKSKNSIRGLYTQKTDVVDIGRLDIRVGRILKAEKHPDADSLYVESIDLGEEKPRTVVSGLVRHIPLDKMQNRLVICLCNLKPVKMRGVESCAMVMCASCPEKVEILEVPETCVPGQKVTCSQYTHRPDPIMNPKKKIWETVAPDLCVDAQGNVSYKGSVLLVDAKHVITAPTLRNVPVK